MTKLLFTRLESERFSVAHLTAFKFIAVGCVWIVGSDLALFFFSETSQSSFSLFRAEVLKGVGFVLAMGLFIYFIIRRNDGKPTTIKLPYLFDKNPIPMWVVDINTLRIVEVNAAAIENYGYSESEFVSMTLNDLRPPEEQSKLLMAANSVANGMCFKGKSTHVKKNGTEAMVEISAYPILFNHTRAALVVSYDISNHVRLEEEMKLLRETSEKKLNDKLYEVALYNKELQIRIREVNSTNDELIEVNKLLLDSNSKCQHRAACAQERNAEQRSRLLELVDHPACIWDMRDGSKTYFNSHARNIFGLQQNELPDRHDFWKSCVDPFDAPLIDIHLAILDKDDIVEFTFKLANRNTLVRMKVISIRDENENLVAYEYVGRII